MRASVEVHDEFPVGGAGGIEFLVPLGDRGLQVNDLLHQMGDTSLQGADVGGIADIGIPELSEPVDVVLNFAPIAPEQMAALSGVIRDGGVLVDTTVWMPAASDEARSVQGINLFFRPDADQLAQLVTLLDAAGYASERLAGCRWRPSRRCTPRSPPLPSTARSSSSHQAPRSTVDGPAFAEVLAPMVAAMVGGTTGDAPGTRRPAAVVRRLPRLARWTRVRTTAWWNG